MLVWLAAACSVALLAWCCGALLRRCRAASEELRRARAELERLRPGAADAADALADAREAGHRLAGELSRRSSPA